MIKIDKRLSVCIIEDSKGDYERMIGILKNTPYNEDFRIVSKFFGEQPFIDALEYVKLHEPRILIIDYDLGQGSQKTGLNFYKEISEYRFFAIYYSRDSDHASAALGGYGNVQFIKKRIDPIVSIQELNEKLELAKQYLTGDITIELKCYRHGKSTGRSDEHYITDEILCKNLLMIYGKEKEYHYVFNNNGKFIERTGPARNGAGEIVEAVMSTGYGDFIWHTKNPHLLYNKYYFGKIPLNGKKHSLKDTFISSKRYEF